MSTPWPTSPWVEEYRHRVGFAVQVFPNDTPNDPDRHLVAAAQLAEEVGFDAFFASDHPSWGLDGWLHLAAVAATTRRIRLG